MVTTIWADSTGGAHTVLATRVASASSDAAPIHAYALRRPDGRIAILLINRDPQNDWTVDVHGLDSASTRLDAWRLSAAEYTWHPDGAKGYAKPNTGPREMSVARGAALVLPPYSVTVVRERE